jgi:hypothetical protein
MSGSHHAPAPWKNGRDANGNAIVCQGDDVRPDDEYYMPTAQANCALVDAAPDMLAALQAVADYWAGGDVPPELDAQIRAALVKARRVPE